MNIGKDKWMHFGVCGILALLFAILFIGALKMPVFGGTFAAIMVSLGAGFGKEYGDKVNPNNYWDWYDVYADLAGALIGGLLGSVIYLC